MVTTWSTPGVSLAMLATCCSVALRAAERGAVGQLHGGEQIALVLDRQEAGGHARHAVAGGPMIASAMTPITTLWRTIDADQPRIAVLHALVDIVEAAIEGVALVGRHRAPQPQSRIASASASRR